jgi:hypothetical protein
LRGGIPLLHRYLRNLLVAAVIPELLRLLLLRLLLMVLVVGYGIGILPVLVVRSVLHLKLWLQIGIVLLLILR